MRTLPPGAGFRLSMTALLLAAAACAPKQSVPVAPAVVEPPPPSVSVEAAKKPRETRCELAQGADSRVETPFVAVVRDEAGYQALARQSGIVLPPLEAGFFPTGVVVAAFLGVRSTPGYRVSIRHEGETFRIVEEGPPQAAILAQVITTPFVVAAYGSGPATNFSVDPGERLGASLKHLGIVSGKLEVSGGILGRFGTFVLDGELRVASLGELTTLFVDIHGKSEDKTARLATVTTFSKSAEGRFAFALPNAGDFVPPPCRALALSGRIGGEGPKLFVNIAAGPCSASDAFSANGNIQAAPVDAPSR